VGWLETFNSLFSGRGHPLTPVDSRPVEAPAPAEPFNARLLAAAGVDPRRTAVYLPPLNAAAKKFDIVTPLRRSMFLAQVAHESAAFQHVVEIWGPTQAQMGYENRVMLGNVVPGDGFRFRGRGLIQITGRANYEAVGSFFGWSLAATPSFLESPAGACLSAGWFWMSHGCNELADVGDFAGVTRRINGGLNGYAHRSALWSAIYKIIDTE
jgi:putative chitinase